MKLECDEPLSKFAFNFNLRRCTAGVDTAARASAVLGARQCIEAGGAQLLAGMHSRQCIQVGGAQLLAGMQCAGGGGGGGGRGGGGGDGEVGCVGVGVGVGDGLILPAMRGAIDFRSVTFAYRSRASHLVLDGFDLSLAPGEVSALVGSSGGGKSTVGALLERFYDPSLGAVEVDGGGGGGTGPALTARERGRGVVGPGDIRRHGLGEHRVRSPRRVARRGAGRAGRIIPATSSSAL